MNSAMPLSISHLPAGIPWWIFAAVVLALVLRIGGGSVGILSGYAAVSVRKGERLLARHLWRMCIALFFAAGSFFLGQQKVMPVFMHGTPLLFVPAFAPLVLMIFWLFRVRFATAFRKLAVAT